MMQLGYGDLRARDIIVAEAALVRWPISDKEDAKTARYRKRSWEQWRVEFRLEAIYYMYEGSQHAAAGPTGAGEDLDI